VTFSTTHIGFITALQMTECIKGVSGKDYFYDSLLRQKFEEGLVKDIGYVPAIDYETILQIKPDVIFMYGLEAADAGFVSRFRDAGTPVIMISEFLESHPLGKAEWIKLFAVLLGLEEKGDSIFYDVSENYLKYAAAAKNIEIKPKVLTGLPWKGTWYMAGGSSFMAKLINDAGGDYLWSDNASEDYIPLNLEAVISRAGDADVWINCGTAASINELLSRDSRFENVKALKNGNVFNNNARLNEAGGNDFWESGTVRPDLILKDLIGIFHPSLIEADEMMYYERLK
jgi:iron complex transport system substrate-binding protein